MKTAQAKLGLAGSFLLVISSAAHAATPLPVWYGEPNTTRSGYQFSTSSTTPSPEVSVNPYGLPTATVAVGSFSTGWQNPATPFTLPGVEADGAWDLGVSGTMTLMVPFAPAAPGPGQSYRVDFLVYMVGYDGPTSLPTLTTPGLAVTDLTSSDALVLADPPGAWRSRTWMGTAENVTGNFATFQLNAPSNGSVVDTYEIHTRFTLVPEPSVAAGMLVVSGLTLLRRRR